MGTQHARQNDAKIRMSFTVRTGVLAGLNAGREFPFPKVRRVSSGRPQRKKC